MEVFIWMYVLLIMIAVIGRFLYPTSRRIFSSLACFTVLFLILALRAPWVGNDLAAYVPYFQLGATSARGFEAGYEFLNKAIFAITPETSWFLAIVAFISLFPIAILINRYSTSIVMSYIIFSGFIIYHFMFSGIRQGVALGVIALSFICLEKKMLIPFVLLVLLASLFHISSIVFFVVYPLCNWLKMTNKKYLIFSVLGLCIIIGLKPFLTWLVPLIFDEGKYVGYLDHDAMPAYNLFILVFTIFVSTFFVKTPSTILSKYRMILFLAVMCQSLGFISQEATRIAYYFFLCIPLAIPEVLSELRIKKIGRNILGYSISAFMIFFFFYANAGGYLKVIPYSFLWEQFNTL